MKRYRMPNGHVYLFDEDKAPAYAELIEPKKKARRTSNKAKTASNKAKETKTKAEE